MAAALRELRIPISGCRHVSDENRHLLVVARKDESLAELPVAEAEEKGVSPWQLCECARYEYQLPEGCTFNISGGTSDAIIQQSKIAGRQNEGQIRTGSYVGRFRRRIYDLCGKEIGEVEFEVRSKKLDYIAQYRYMLKDIAERCDELLMLQSSPVLQTFDVDPGEDAKTLYERFTFLKAILDNDEFVSAVQRICANPMERLTTVCEEVPVAHSHRIGRAALRQFASARDRVELAADDSLRAYGIDSLPRRIEFESRELTKDTPENRFVKFALETFADFLERLRELPGAGVALKRESESLVEKLETMLSDPFFRDVGRMRRIPLQSPLLQRREGYRQVLRSWILFDCAAKFVWQGGDDVYDAGKRDVATLYEYWVFFQLYQAVCKVFKLDEKSSDKLVKVTKNKMAITLRRGRVLDLNASSEYGRKLHVRFSFNRSFSPDELKVSGTWTTGMRPDYTLSIWPGDLDEKSAEAVEAIVHVHFDAKYRLERMEDILGKEIRPGEGEQASDTDEEDCEARDRTKKEEAELIYRQGDLLKMHAYNDAVRRTYGSYIIYPGDETDPRLMREYHEILPGLGAFALRPTDGGSIGVENLVKFITDVRDVMVQRMTQRERAAIHRGRIYDGRPKYPAVPVYGLPDYAKGVFPPIPAEETVLVGYCKLEQMQWVAKHRLYNFRYEHGLRGSIELTPEFLCARYLLIHSQPENLYPPVLLRLEDRREILTDKDLKKLKYPSKNPSAKLYFCVGIVAPITSDMALTVDCDISQLANVPRQKCAKGKEPLHLPFYTTLEDVYLHMCVKPSPWGKTIFAEELRATAEV